MVVYSLHVISQIDMSSCVMFPQNRLSRSVTDKIINSLFLLNRNFISWQRYSFLKSSEISKFIFNPSTRDHQKAIKHFNRYCIIIKFMFAKPLHSIFAIF